MAQVPIPVSPEESNLAKEELIRAELNIEKWPLFTISQFKGKSREYIRQEILPSGDIQSHRVTIGRIPGGEAGVLRILDLKCYYALIKLWEDAGRPVDRPVAFAIHRIAILLGRSWSGKTHRQIKESLLRLRGLPITWISSFYRKDTDTTEELLELFNILSELRIYERREAGRRTLALSSFKFNDLLLRNLVNNHSKPLHLEVMFHLKNEVSMLLYQRLDLMMAGRTHYERRSQQLIEEDLNLSGNYRYPSYRKRVLEPALEELEGVKLSTGILSYARLRKAKGSSEWKAVFHKEPYSVAEGRKPRLRGGQRQRSTGLEKDPYEIEGLVREMVSITEDAKSRQFYLKIAMRCPTDLIYRVLSEVKEEWHQGLIRTTKGAVFTDKIKRYCQEWGIELGLKVS